MEYSICKKNHIRLSESKLTGLTQSLIFCVVDRVLYLTNIKSEIEWVQLPLTLSSNDVVDMLLYMMENIE